MAIDTTASSLTATFTGATGANGTNELSLEATLVDTDGSPISGASVEFVVSPQFSTDSLTVFNGTTTDSGQAAAGFTTFEPSIKVVTLIVDGEAVPDLSASAEFTPVLTDYLVEDPFTTNGQLTSDITMSGQEITLKAETNNSGAITEITWNGQQILNSLNKDREFQTKMLLDNFGGVDFARLNEAGALSQAWGDPSTSRYIGDLSNTRELLTQSFLSYREPINYEGLELACSGNIFTKQVYMDFLGNPNIVLIDTRLDQFASSKRGSNTWALNLSLTQVFNKFYTFRPDVDDGPVEQLAAAATGSVSTTYTGGPIVTNANGSLAVGLFRAPKEAGNSLLSTIVKPSGLEGGDPKFTENYFQLIDLESSGNNVGISAGTHHANRYLCVGTLSDVAQAFEQLYVFVTSGEQIGAEQDMIVQSAPTSVNRFQQFNIVLAVVDSEGNTVSDYNLPVNASVLGAQNQLQGTTTVLFQSGVATFTDLSITEAGFQTLVFQSGVLSTSTPITVNNPVPFFSGMSPDTAPDSSSDIDLVVVGSNFVDDAVVIFANAPLATTYISSSELNAVIPSNLLTEGQYRVRVLNPAPGGGPSNQQIFTVTDGTPPSVSNIDINVQGQNFTVSWDTDEPSTTRLTYINTTTQSVNQVTDPAFSTTHLVSVSSAELGDYEGIITTQDTAGNTQNTDRFDWSLNDVTPPVISTIQVTDVTTSSARLIFTTNESARIDVEYTQAGSSGSTTINFPGFRENHDISLSGLDPATAYSVTVTATDPSGNFSTRDTQFTTESVGDPNSPEFESGPDAINITSVSAAIDWRLNEPATGFVRYGTSPGQYPLTAVNEINGQPVSVQQHTVQLGGLAAGTVYYYIVDGEDPAGNPYSSSEQSFLTASPPTVGDLSPGDEVVTLELEVPPGRDANDEYICHAVVPLVKQTDWNINWAVGDVNGAVVQRHIVNYKPKAEVVAPEDVIFQEQDGIVAIEFESGPTNNWVLATDTTGFGPFTGQGYFIWPEGSGTFFNDPAGSIAAGGLLTYNVSIDNAATYTLHIRNQHFEVNGDPTEDNDVWVRVDNGEWEKVFSNGLFQGGTTTEEWNWESRTERNASQPPATYDLTAGQHTIEFTARSENFRMDRFHLAVEGQPNATNENFPQSSILNPEEGNSGINSVECIFPVTVPAGVSEGELFNVTLVATANSPGAALSPNPITGLNMVMTMPQYVSSPDPDQTADILAPNNAVTLKSGEHCVEYRYFNRLTDGVNPTLGVHTYVTYYDPSIDEGVYVRTLITNSILDPSADFPNYGFIGKVYFDELYVDSSSLVDPGPTTRDRIFPRHVSYCMNQTPLNSNTRVNLVEYTQDPNETVARNDRDPSSTSYILDPVNRSSLTAGRSEIFPGGMQRIEHLVLKPAGSNDTTNDLTYMRGVLDYQNMARTVDGRNAGKNNRWFGPGYMRSAELPDTYEINGTSYVPANPNITGSRAYDKMRMDGQGIVMKEILTTNQVKFGSGPHHVIAGDWAPVAQFGCWTPGFSLKGSEGGTAMMQMYETAPGPGHTKGWSYWYDLVLQRHWITAFDDTGRFLSVRDWWDTPGGLRPGGANTDTAPFPEKSGTGGTHLGFYPFFINPDEPASEDNQEIWSQKKFNEGVCAYDTSDGSLDINPQWPFSDAWQSYSPISSTHIQRTLRCNFGLTNTVHAQMYKDLLRYQGERYLYTEDHRVDFSYVNAGSDNGTIGQVLRDFVGPSRNRTVFLRTSNVVGRGSPGYAYGRNKAWANFTLALYYMHVAPEESYSDGYSIRQHIRDHFNKVHEALGALIPGGFTPTYNTPGGTRRRFISGQTFTKSAYDSNKRDVGATVYRYDSLEEPGTLTVANPLLKLGGYSNENGSAQVVGVYPETPTSGIVHIYHTDNPGSFLNSNPEDFEDTSSGPSGAEQNSRIIYPGGPSEVTVDILEFIETVNNQPVFGRIGGLRITDRLEEWQLIQGVAQTMEMHLFQHMMFAAATGVLGGFDVSKANDLHLLVFEMIQAVIDNPGYYDITPGGDEGPEGGYSSTQRTILKDWTTTNSSGDIIGGEPIVVNDRYTEEPLPPFMCGGYANDFQGGWQHFTQIAAAYSAEALGVYPISLTNPLILEGLRVGWLPIDPTTVSDFEQAYTDKMEYLAEWFSSGSSSRARERWYKAAPWFGEVQYLLSNPEPAVTTVEWNAGAPITVGERAGTINSIRVRTAGGLLAAQDAVFSLGIAGTADPDDYVVNPGPYTISTGQSSVDVPVTIINNTDNDGDRTLELTIVSGDPNTEVNPSRDALTIVIEDDDPSTPTINFTSGSSVIYEGDPQRVVSLFINPPPAAPLDIGVTVSGTASASDYNISGLGANDDTLSLDVGQSSAQFFVQASEEDPPVSDPGETIVFTLDPGTGYAVGASDELTLTIDEIGDLSDSFVMVKRTASGDGAAGPGPAVPTLVSATVPLNPPLSTLPSYWMEHPSDPGNLVTCQVDGVARNKDGRFYVAQVTALLPNDDLVGSIPGDNNNPAIKIGKGAGAGLPTSGVNVIPPSLHELEIKLANVTTPFICRPAEVGTTNGALGPGTVEFDGPYLRRTVYYGQFVDPDSATPGNRPKDEYALVVKLIVTERADFAAAAIDVVIENSALDSTLADALDVNPRADGTVYFEYIKYKALSVDYSIVSGADHPSSGIVSGTSDREYWIVKDQDSIVGQPADQMHAILPGQMFARRLGVKLFGVPAVHAEDVVKRYDWGYVEGPLGYFSGGYGEAGWRLPKFSDISGMSINGETGIRAWKEYAEAENIAAITDLQSGTIAGDSEVTWGWAKPSGRANPFINDEEGINILGIKSPLWTAAETSLINLDRSLERFGYAAFNVSQVRPYTEEDLIATGSATDRLPYGFALYGTTRRCGIAWQQTNPIDTSTVTTTGSWALAPTDRPWNTPDAGKSVYYIDTAGYLNWHTSPNGSWGPHSGQKAHRVHSAYRAPIYLFNDHVAKILATYEGEVRLLGLGRYDQVTGSSQAAHRLNTARDRNGVRWMETTENNTLNTSLLLNQGFHYRRNGRVESIGSHEEILNPITSILIYYSIASSGTRSRLSDGGSVISSSTHNWWYLASRFISRNISPSGALFASERNFKNLYGTPGSSTEVAVVNSRTGFAPGPREGTNSSNFADYNNQQGFHYTAVEGLSITHGVNTAAAMLNLAVSANSPLANAWRLVASPANDWSDYTDFYVVSDPVEAGVGVWWNGAALINSVGSDGADNSPITRSRVANGDTFWYGQTLDSVDDRAPHHFLLAAAGYQKAVESFGSTLKGAKRNFSADGVTDSAFYTTLETDIVTAYNTDTDVDERAYSLPYLALMQWFGLT